MADRTAWVPRPIGFLIVLAGLTYLVQGWTAGAEGFSPTNSTTIVLDEVLNVARMVWLVVVAWRMKLATAASAVRERRFSTSYSAGAKPRHGWSGANERPAVPIIGPTFLDCP